MYVFFLIFFYTLFSCLIDNNILIFNFCNSRETLFLFCGIFAKIIVLFYLVFFIILIFSIYSCSTNSFSSLIAFFLLCFGFFSMKDLVYFFILSILKGACFVKRILLFQFTFIDLSNFEVFVRLFLTVIVLGRWLMLCRHIFNLKF